MAARPKREDSVGLGSLEAPPSPFASVSSDEETNACLPDFLGETARRGCGSFSLGDSGRTSGGVGVGVAVLLVVCVTGWDSFPLGDSGRTSGGVGGELFPSGVAVLLVVCVTGWDSFPLGDSGRTSGGVDGELFPSGVAVLLVVCVTGWDSFPLGDSGRTSGGVGGELFPSGVAVLLVVCVTGWDSFPLGDSGRTSGGVGGELFPSGVAVLLAACVPEPCGVLVSTGIAALGGTGAGVVAAAGGREDFPPVALIHPARVCKDSWKCGVCSTARAFSTSSIHRSREKSAHPSMVVTLAYSSFGFRPPEFRFFKSLAAFIETVAWPLFRSNHRNIQ